MKQRINHSFRHSGIIIIAGLTASLLLLAGFAGAESVQGLQVTRALISLDVLEREPVGEGWRFPAAAKRVYCFTEIRGAATPTTITHIWYYEDRVVHEYPLAVEGPGWRTWSYKNIHGSQQGEWKVEIQDAGGVVLSTVFFIID